MPYVKSFDNTKIHYDFLKPKKKKRGALTLIFMHGLGGNARSLNSYSKYFAKLGYPSICIDFRGHGFSDRPENISDYSVEISAKDLNAVLKKEHVKNFVLIGHCMGGMVAVTYEKLFPKRANALILVDSTYMVPPVLGKCFRNPLIRPFFYLLSRSASHSKPKKRIGGLNNFGFFRIFGDLRETSFHSWLFTLNGLSDYDGRETLHLMNTPVLILDAKNDTLFGPSIAKKIHKYVKKSKLKFIPGNHIAVILDPPLVERPIEMFLESLS